MDQSFSERMGITKPPALQLESMSQELQHLLWNCVHRFFEGIFITHWVNAAHRLGHQFFKERADHIPSTAYQAREWIAERYFRLKWYEVYNFLEFMSAELASLAIGGSQGQKFENAVNEVLKNGLSGYRFVSGRLAPITNATELAAIEEAIESSNRPGLAAINAHLTKAVDLFSQKPKSDYHNAIKEAITAVEGLANLLSGDTSSGLGRPLNELAKRVPIHPAMKEAFLKLYGYTSSKEGIRHPMLEGSGVGFDEAKFMLVACSAFVYFLISKASAAGLLKNQRS